MQVTGDNYQAVYDRRVNTVFLVGNFRLNGPEEYQPVMFVLLEALAAPDTLIVDVSKLDFLNSSGIAVLSKFVLEARKRGVHQLMFNANEDITWQSKSLKNLQRLMPSLTLNFQSVPVISCDAGLAPDSASQLH